MKCGAIPSARLDAIYEETIRRKDMGQQSQAISSSTTGTNGGNAATTGVGSPITNEAYNVLTALQAKLEGLEAYRKYAKDSDAGLWQQLTQIELQAVTMLVNEVERLVQEGKFKMKEPGRANA
jgi:hypothetical protein